MKTQDYKDNFPGHMVTLVSRASIEKMQNTKLEKHKNSERRKKAKIRSQRNQQFADALSCQLCGFTSKTSLISHITRIHHVDMTEYRNKFPSCVTQRMTVEQKQSISENLKKKLEDEVEKKKFLDWRSYPTELKHWMRKGLSQTEAEAARKQWQSETGLKQNCYPELLERKSKQMSGDNNHMSLQSLAEKHGVSLEEAKKYTPCYGRSGEKHPMFGKNHTEQSLQKIASAPHVANPDYRSTPERQLEEQCRNLGNLKTNVQIKRYNVDVLFEDKNLIVEMFGDYWHMNPDVYPPDAINLYAKKTAKQIWDRDARKIETLRSIGYDVVVVWERDWRLKKELIMKEIADAYHRAR